MQRALQALQAAEVGGGHAGERVVAEGLVRSAVGCMMKAIAGGEEPPGLATVSSSGPGSCLSAA